MKISTSVRFGMAFGFAMVAALACGDDDDSPGGGSPGAGGDGQSGGASAGGEGGEGGEEPGAGGEGGTPGVGGEGGEPAAGGMGQGGAGMNPCDPTGVDTGDEDCPELVECVETECQEAYQTCLGDDYLNGDFTGGECEEYMTCVSECGSAEDCDTDCVEACDLDDACLNCLTTTVGFCVLTNCQDEATECGFGAGGAGFGGSGFGGSGFGGFGGASAGGCAELEACCDSLAGQDQTACNMALQAASGFDVACGIVLSGYQSGGQCE